MVMKIGGWKTKAMFSRYNIANKDRLREAMERGGEYIEKKAMVRWSRGAMVQRLARSPFKFRNNPRYKRLSIRFNDLRSLQQVTTDASRCPSGAIRVQVDA